MFSRRFKTGYFILEGMNSFATVYYFYYFYFFMQRTFDFGNKANLALAALNGATYAVFALLGGRFAQRFGYFTSLKLGFLIMMSSLAVGLKLGASSAPGQIAVMGLTVVGMSFTWPTLEALVSEGEPAGGVQHMVGLYNVIWAATAAVASFSGGAMLQQLGSPSLFYVPAGLHASQLALTLWLERQAKRNRGAATPQTATRAGLEPVLAGGPLAPGGAAGGISTLASNPPVAAPAPPPTRHANAKGFLRMAWLANPFAYIAINTLIAAMPGVARRLELSTMLAGFCGSVWCFARLAAFITLWQWSGWHYRFRWLLLAYLGLVGTFAAILLAPSPAVLVSAQVVFGGALGLLYYSSLFYSMDCSDTKGEHGGIHESVIGLGNFTGPAVGAVALQFAPQSPNSGAVAVTLVLLSGLGGLTVVWRLGRNNAAKASALAEPHHANPVEPIEGRR